MKKESPVKIGIEVESAFPTNAFARKNPEVRKHLDTKPYGFETDKILYSGHDGWEDGLPDGYKSPAGWQRGFDGEMEFRFSGPASTLKEAFKRLDNLQVFIDNWGIDKFTNSGTHIHFGMFEFLKKKYFPKGLNASNGLFTTAGGNTAAALASVDHAIHYTAILRFYQAYFVSRQAAIWKLISPWRRTYSYCHPATGFYIPIETPGSVFGHDPYTGASICKSTPSTPLQVIHNAIRAGVSVGSVADHAWCPSNRKGLPTFEFRAFPATAKMDAVKGYLILMQNMLHRAIAKVDEIGYDELVRVRAVGEAVPDFVAPFHTYTYEQFVKEVEETDFYREPLLAWMEATILNNGEPTNFNLDANINAPSETTNQVDFAGSTLQAAA